MTQLSAVVLHAINQAKRLSRPETASTLGGVEDVASQV